MSSSIIAGASSRPTRGERIPVNNSNMATVLVKMSRTDEFVAISTYCRQIGRRGRFLILADSLRRVLDEDHVSVLDTDCGHHVQIHKYNGMLHITFDWLSEYGDGHLKGFRQRVAVPCEVFGQLLETGASVTYLYRPHEAQARIDTSHIANVIRTINEDSVVRRALSKAMRDHFHWDADQVTLYWDGDKDFFFRTASGCPAEGGLILHQSSVRTPIGMRPRLYYGVHT